MASFDARLRFGGQCNKLDAYSAVKTAVELLNEQGFDVGLAELHPTSVEDEQNFPVWEK